MITIQKVIRDSKEIDSSVTVLRNELTEIDNQIKAINYGVEQNKIKQQELLEKIGDN